MHHRWLPPSILGLAALCAAVIGGWAVVEGATILVLLPAVVLVAALATWRTKVGVWVAFGGAALALIVGMVLGDLVEAYLLPAALFAAMAAALKLAPRRAEVRA
ncbi:hypothetical protein [Tessaracoccus palaemonis]|uniref:Uncharacterized protein n=1 Tax=Tessaracoccus palaemonis TaxID=2829499 RepID=A0ABX8SKM6_9ACTN|nr:hypothetical protein [Tessaracoccus palaemonis]QXT63936.1 hypothetical protein KDB89_05635 [Tessaracoccus palaemonis]